MLKSSLPLNLMKELSFSLTPILMKSSRSTRIFSSNSTLHGGKFPIYTLTQFSPFSGHCKKLAPEYVKAAETLSKNDPPLSLAKVDATEEKALAERFGIQGFPTLYFFKNGEKLDYTGGRTAETIVNWMLKKTGPPSKEVTCDGLTAEVDANDFVLAYFGDVANAAYTDAHVGFANVEEKVKFVHAPADCAAAHGGSAEGFVFFRKL